MKILPIWGCVYPSIFKDSVRFFSHRFVNGERSFNQQFSLQLLKIQEFLGRIVEYTHVEAQQL